MAKKSFKQDIATGADRFFSVHDQPADIQDTLDTRDIQDTSNTPRTQDTPAEKPYRINLKLDPGLKDFLADAAWRQRTSVTALLNQIIADYRRQSEAREDT